MNRSLSFWAHWFFLWLGRSHGRPLTLSQSRTRRWHGRPGGLHRNWDQNQVINISPHMAMAAQQLNTIQLFTDGKFYSQKYQGLYPISLFNNWAFVNDFNFLKFLFTRLKLRWACLVCRATEVRHPQCLMGGVWSAHIGATPTLSQALSHHTKKWVRAPEDLTRKICSNTWITYTI